MTDELPIVAKLVRTRLEAQNLECTRYSPEPINPDGPEAAAVIGELVEALDRMVRKFGGTQNPPLSPGQNAALQYAAAALAKVRDRQCSGDPFGPRCHCFAAEPASRLGHSWHRYRGA